jgi:xanthine dehydrogenase iron-sulfur cluster and FAD-binding subunit A
LQCGYCTPGFVVEVAAFTDRWRAEHGAVAPPRSVIAAAMAGHLCRCGAYPGIYAAIAAACAEDVEPVEPVAEPPRVEAWEKVTGRRTAATRAPTPLLTAVTFDVLGRALLDGHSPTS